MRSLLLTILLEIQYTGKMMKNVSVEEIMYCHKEYKGRSKSSISSYNESSPKQRLLYYRKRTPKVKAGTLGRHLQSINSNNDKAVDLCVAMDHVRKDLKFTALNNVAGDSRVNRNKSYWSQVLEKDKSVVSQGHAPHVFSKLRRMYLDYEKPAIKARQDYKLPKLDVPTIHNNFSSVKDLPYEDESFNRYYNTEKFSGSTKITHSRMLLIADLKEIERPLNNRISRLRAKLAQLSQKKFIKRKSPVKEVLTAPFKKRSSAILAPDSLHNYSPHPTKHHVRRMTYTETLSPQINPHWGINSATGKFIKEIADKNPFLSILAWTLSCPNNLLQKQLLLKYLTYCIEEQARPVPLYSDSTSTTLIIENAKLTGNQGRVIGKTMQHLPQSIRRLVIKAKGLPDEPLSDLLVGVVARKAVNGLELEQVTIGVKSIFILNTILTEKKLTPLLELALVSVSIPCLLLQKLFEDIANSKALHKLTLSGIQCDDNSIDNLAAAIKNSKSLYYLNLSQLSISCLQLIRVMSAIILNQKIEYLDLSHLPFGTQGGTMLTEIKQELLQYLAFIIRESPCLIHIDVSHTRLAKSQAKKLIKAALKSESILSLHLADNAISTELIKSFQKVANSVCLYDDTQPGCVLWRAKNIPVLALQNAWIASNECFICDKWKVAVFLSDQNLPVPRLSCDTYKNISIPFTMKHSREDICKFIESQIHMKPCYNISQFEVTHFAAVLLPPKDNLKYRITYTNGEIHEGTIAVTPRVEEIHGSLHSMHKPTIREFSKLNSIFADWRVDTEKQLRKMMETDYERTKIRKFIKSEKENNALLLLLGNYAHDIKELFTAIASNSLYPYISWLDFAAYFQKKQILDKTCTLADLDRFFIAVNVDLGKKSEEKANPERALCRHEFVEILVRIANRKYKETGRAKTHAEAVKLLLEEILKGEDFGISSFRETKVWTLVVDDLLRGNLPELKQVFWQNSTNGKYISLKSAINLIRKKCGMRIPEKDIIKAYGYSKMTLVDELGQIQEYKQMLFEEFLEFIVRIPETQPVAKHLAIEDKLDRFLAKLLAKHQLIKKPPYSPENLLQLLPFAITYIILLYCLIITSKSQSYPQNNNQCAICVIAF
eukprot:TRINITY_DN2451_c0_g1_i1.p1 TRINITY_DN2451_c0_g1~~TRINITY_DN2451_c0_g1_i1.p1  ORF type:complete len:1113 (+),score=77.31 TRINITY_DN2451_c0_g1_i1:8406-11744(+)